MKLAAVASTLGRPEAADASACKLPGNELSFFLETAGSLLACRDS
jgi:hypothetical protein